MRIINCLSKYMLVVVTAVLLLQSCSKDRIQETQLNQYGTLNTYFDSKKQAEQEFIIDTAGNSPIIGNQGTKIGIGKQCLQFPNGDSVAWPFTVKLVELYKPKDMIYYQMPTVASGNILATEGEIRLRAFKNNTELVLKPSPCLAQVEFRDLDSVRNTNMIVYYGTQTNNLPDWNGIFGFTNTSYGYSAPISKLGWINCGKLTGTTVGSKLIFTSSTDDLTNVGIFIYIPSTKTVMQVYNNMSSTIPNGLAVKITAIAAKSNGDLFSFSQALTVNTNNTINVTLSAITDANLTSALDNL
jgi:hypothetical protein